jgi:HEAT repeat protein
VTQALAEAVQEGGVSIKASNDLLGGDPVPNVVKSLRVSYTLGGAAKQVEIPENGVFELAGAPLPGNPRETSVVSVLAKRGDPAALPVVLKLAQEGPWDVRLAAIRALARLGDASAVPVLLETAVSGQGAQASAALDSLADLPDKAADAKLEGLLDGSSGQQQLVIIELLGRREITSAVPALLALASGADKATRDAAFAALGLTVDQNHFAVLVKHLVAPASSDVATAAKAALQKACLRMPDRDAAARILIDQLRSVSGQVQADLLDLLGVVGGEQALARVVAAAQANDEKLQDAATQVLGRWTSPDAAPALLELTKAANNRYKVRTLRGYIRIARQLNVPTDERIEMCRKALELADRDDDRKLIVETLGRYPSATSLALVAAQLNKPALGEVAAAAALSIGQKLVDKQPAEVAKVMKQVIAAPPNDDLKQKATRLLHQAEGKK